MLKSSGFHEDRRYLFLLLLAGLGVFIWKGYLLSAIRFIGFGDPAGYAEIAQSILEGRGLEVDYISMHFRISDPGVSHPEDTWPPLYALLIAPFFAILGKSALAAKLPSLLVACFAFPTAAYALARNVVASRAVAFAAAITVLLAEPISTWSLQATADVTFGFLATLALVWTLRGLCKPKWFYPMGLTLALAYYAKASALFIAAAIVVYYIFLRLFQRSGCCSSRRTLHFVAAMALFGLLLVPWLARNQSAFDDPFYSNHKCVAGYVGWAPWDKSTYDLYWNREPPSLSDKFSDPARLFSQGAEFFKHHLWMLFIRTDPDLCMREPVPLPAFSFGDLTTYPIGIPALLGAVLYVAYAFRRQRSSNSSAIEENNESATGASQEPSGYGLFLLTILTYITIHSLLWVPHARLTLPLLPLVAIAGWHTIYILCRGLFYRTRAPAKAAATAVLVLACIWSAAEIRDFFEARAQGRFPYNESGHSLMEIGDWIRQNAPDSVIMTENPWALHFYSGEKTVRLPEAGLEKVFKAAKYYGVTHIIPDGFDPIYTPWVRGSIPGLKRVLSTSGLELFEIDFSEIAGHEW